MTTSLFLLFVLLSDGSVTWESVSENLCFKVESEVAMGATVVLEFADGSKAKVKEAECWMITEHESERPVS